MIKKTAHILRKMYRRFQPGDRKPAAIASQFVQQSYSQCGEDLVIDFLFKFIIPVKKPSFIDVGAFDPYFLSNTAKLYERGCFGMNIEPNPEQFAAFTYYRPESINLNMGVGLSAGTLDYHMYADPYLNSFEQPAAGQPPLKTLPVPVAPLAELVRTHFKKKPIDFLSVDTEGFDLAVLQSLDLAVNRPKVICVETLQELDGGGWKVNEEVISYIQGFDYRVHASTHINTIFVDTTLRK